MDEIDKVFNKIRSNLSNQKSIETFLSLLLSFDEDLVKENDKHKYYDKIINTFFDSNTIHYCKTSKIFFYFHNSDIIPCNEDNAIYSILDFITNNKFDGQKCHETSVKQLLKNKIMKSIKEYYPIRDIIPESETIQSILNCLNPGIFSSKTYAKFFCVILGDIVLKKYTERKYFYVRPHLKSFLNEINKNISIYITNINIFNYFKFKYMSEHEDYEKYLLPSNEINMQYIVFNTQFYMNLLCTCIYYSNRYDNIEVFINDIDDNVERNKILYFDNNNKSSIISSFVDKFLISDSDQSIVEKDLLFLWKKFIIEGNISLNIFSNHQEFIKDLFKHLGSNYDVNSTKNVIHNYYSLDIPYVSSFIEFWQENFEIDEHEQYFELNEVLFLFNKYDKRKKHNVNEQILQEIIQNYFPTINIINDKIIHNLTCKLWNKKSEIDLFLKKSKLNIKTDSLNSIYKQYCKSKTKFENLKISKKYFGQYIETLKTLQ